MNNKYFIPATTMFGGLFVWVAFLIFHETNGAINVSSLWLGAGLCLVAGGLVFFSAVRCRQVGGPRIGNIVRTVLLIVMTTITYWRVGTVVAGVLAVAAITTGSLLLMGSYQSKVAEGSVSSAVQARNKFN